MSNKKHNFSIQLYVDCPQCDEQFDFIDTENWHESIEGFFREQKDVQCVCPICSHEFKFDIVEDVE